MDVAVTFSEEKIMKKFTLIIALLTITFAFSVQAQTTASKMPAEVQTTLQKAVKAEQADPPIDVAFLYEVSSDKNIRQYVETVMSPIEILLGEGHILISTSEYGGTRMMVGNEGCADNIECHNDGPYIKGITQKNENAANYDCALNLTEYLRSHRQSEFWAALTSALQTGNK